MSYPVIQFLALLLLMLVTGIFWGPQFSLHRSLHVFNKKEFILIVKTLSDNLAMPMRFMMPSCILFMLLSVVFFPDKNSFPFYLILISFLFIVGSLIITLAVELPIVTRILQWTEASIPDNWESIRDRWVKFHYLRTATAIASFACFIAAILFFK